MEAKYFPFESFKFSSFKWYILNSDSFKGHIFTSTGATRLSSLILSIFFHFFQSYKLNFNYFMLAYGKT